MALPKPKPQAAASTPALINFGAMTDYTAGGAVPEGDYLLSDHTVMMHTLAKKDGTLVGDAGLFVRVCFEPPTGAEKEEDRKYQYYSMGREAHKSFLPDPNTGKGLVAVAGGKGGSLNDQSNWAIFLASYYNSGLPEGIFTNDLSVLDGVQVHIGTQKEPESRKSMKGAATGEAGQTERELKNIAVVTEIKQGGAPWEGGGGPVAATAKPAKPALAKPGVAAPAKPALVKPKATPPPPPEPAEDESGDTTEQEQAFANAVAAVLEKNPKGMPRMGLRTQTFRGLKDTVGDAMASSLVEAYFADDASLTAVLNGIGFTISGSAVVVLAE